MKKYYVGAKHIGAAIGRGHNASCTHQEMGDAIEEAVRTIRSNTDIDCMVVVKIVRVVRRDHPPVVVEDVE